MHVRYVHVHVYAHVHVYVYAFVFVHVYVYAQLWDRQGVMSFNVAQVRTRGALAKPEWAQSFPKPYCKYMCSCK